MRNTRRKTATVALVGFSLSLLRPGSARGYGGISCSSSESSSASSSESSSDGAGGVVSSTSVSLVSTALVVVVVVMIVNDAGSGDPSGESEGPEARKPELGDATQALLLAGLIATRGELGMQLSLILESPAACDQLDDEVSVGSGPALSALSQSTHLPVQTVAERWRLSRAAVPDLRSQQDALWLVWSFALRLAPDLGVPSAEAEPFLWQLLLERQAPDFPKGANGHRWVASWLGVPVEAVGEATATAFADMDGRDQGAARYAVEISPGRYLHAIAAELETTHKPELDARTREILKDLPPGLIGATQLEDAESPLEEP